MSEYNAVPVGTSAPFEPVVVALVANTTKTVLQIAVASTTDILALLWSVSYDGAAGTAVPVISTLVDTDAGASGLTSLTPGLWGNSQQPASLCIGGAALTGHGGGVTPTEGTIANVRMIDAQHVHPQAGYGIMFAEPIRARIAPSRFLRIRCRAQAAVNVIPQIIWAEPAI